MYSNETNDCDTTVKSSTISMPQDNSTVMTESASLSSQKVPQQGPLHATDINDTSVHNQVGNDTVVPRTWNMADANSSKVYNRRKAIPDSIVNNKYQSVDYKNCLNQNKLGFCFIPYNDLMVCTGQEVVWGSVPDIIQAHELVR